MRSSPCAIKGAARLQVQEDREEHDGRRPGEESRRRAGVTSGACLAALLAAGIPGSALAAPSAPPCDPDPGVGFAVRPAAAILDYRFTGDGDGVSWDDPDNWSFGSWAEEAAPNAGVPAINESQTCITVGGDTGGPFTSFPRVLIEADEFVQITAPIPAIGELEIRTGATVFLQTNLTEFVSDFGNPDVGASIETDGLLIIGAGTSTPLPGATLTANGIVRLGRGATITMDAGAVFRGSGPIELLGASIVVTENLDLMGVELLANEEKNEIRGLPGVPSQRVTLGGGTVDPEATLDLGIAIDQVEIEGLLVAEGQLFLRAAQTRVEFPSGVLVAASPAGRITTQQDGVNDTVELINGNDVFVQTGATLAITGTPGPFDPEDVLFQNQVDGTLVVQEGGLVTTANPPAADVPFVFSFGRVDLGGDIQGTLRSAGLLRIGVPSFDPDIATITGDLELFANSTLQVLINDLIPESGHDQLLVGGTADLDGTLEVTFDFFFSPEPTDGFALIEAGSVAGTFSSVTGDEGLPITYEPRRVFLGGDPDFPDTSDWVRPITGTMLDRDRVSFCLTDAGLHFDMVFGMAPEYDWLALRVSTETSSTFSNLDESLAFNYFALSDQPDPQLPRPEVLTNPGYEGPDRLADGVLDDYIFTSLGNGFFRFRGIAPNGSEPFQGGDVLGSLLIRSSTWSPDADPGGSFGRVTQAYRPPSFADLLTITERPICVPEPGSVALALAALASLGGLARLRRGTRPAHGELR